MGTYACSPGEEMLRPGPKRAVLGGRGEPRRVVRVILRGCRMVFWMTSLKLGMVPLGPPGALVMAMARSWKAALDRIGVVSGRNTGAVCEMALMKSVIWG